MRLFDLVVQPRLGATVGELAPAAGLTTVLPVKLAGPRLCLSLQGGNALLAQQRLLLGPLWVMRHHQAQAMPRRFFHRLLLGRDGLGLEGLQDLYKFTVAPARHRQNEFQSLPAGQLDLAQLVNVVQRQQPPIGHHNQALDVPKAAEYFLQGGQQGGCLGLVAVKHLVVDRQAFCGLHHPEHELAGNQALLGHAVLAYIAFLFRQASGADGGEVIEHQRQILIHQGPQQVGHHIVDRLLVVHQRI